MDTGDFTIPKSWGVSLSRSDSILDGMSRTSSPEPPLNLFRLPPMNDLSSHSTLMQSQLSQFEEKFKLRESIMVGCDTITELANRIPFFSEMLIYSESIREKNDQAHSQDACIRWGATEEQLITEYTKMFIRISDAWLSVRNCFGQDGRCTKQICCLNVSDLSTHYVDWMHASRQLLQSIALGLEKVNVNCKRNAGLQLNPLSMEGSWGYPSDPPCQCHTKSETKPFCTEPAARFQQPPPLYPKPLPDFTNVDISTTTGGTMTPSSYDIPRNKLTESYRKKNIVRVKSDIYKDVHIPRAYVVIFVKSTEKIVNGKLSHKTESEGSLDTAFPEYKSDSEGHSEKEIGKKAARVKAGYNF